MIEPFEERNNENTKVLVLEPVGGTDTFPAFINLLLMGEHEELDSLREEFSWAKQNEFIYDKKKWIRFSHMEGYDDE